MGSIRSVLHLIILLLALSACAEGKQASPGPDSEPQPTTRIFDYEVDDYLALSKYDSETLFTPGFLDIIDDELYIIDYGDLKIKRFSMDGELLNTILESRGEGPGEVQNPTAIDIIDDDVWVLDPNPRKILRFKKSGELIEHLKLPDLALRMVRAEDRFILLTRMNSEIFTTINDSGHVVLEFGQDVTNQVDNRMALDGWMRRTSTGFFYVPRLFGTVYQYGTEGNLLMTFQTIDGLEPPDGKEQTEEFNGMPVMRPPEAEIQTRGISIYKDEIILHTAFKAEQKHGFPSVVDRYRLQDGRYIGLICIPVDRIRLAYAGDRIYSITDSLGVFTLKRVDDR